MNYWLFKSEPGTFGVDDLARAKDATTPWDGVRNYQVRNFLRDAIRKGDQGFFYHSSCAEPGIAGILRVVRAGYAEAAALDPKHRYFDPASDRASPRWYSVDVRLERRIEPVIGLEKLRKHARGALSEMLILRLGNRLSITPVTREEWRFILSLA